MSIDLTGPDEQDWMDGEEAPPIRYSELTTDEERDSAVIEQLEEPLAVVLSGWFSDRGHDTADISPVELRKISRDILRFIETSETTPSLSELLNSVKQPDTDEPEWLDQYLLEVAEKVVDEVPSPLLEYIESTITSSSWYTGFGKPLSLGHNNLICENRNEILSQRFIGPMTVSITHSLTQRDSPQYTKGISESIIEHLDWDEWVRFPKNEQKTRPPVEPDQRRSTE